MNAFLKAIAAGAAGACTTNILHEITRRLTPDAPRVDLLGMQALARLLRASGTTPPTGRTLYNATLASDLASNTAYFGVLGAGAGAVLLPPALDLSGGTTGRTGATAALTVARFDPSACRGRAAWGMRRLGMSRPQQSWPCRLTGTAGGLILDSSVRHGSSSAVLRRRVPVPTGSSIHRQFLAPRRSDWRKNHGDRVNGQPGSPDEPR